MKEHTYWKKVLAQDEKELKKIERAKERFFRKENRKDLKELKRYERVLDKGLGLDKNWL